MSATEPVSQNYGSKFNVILRAESNISLNKVKINNNNNNDNKLVCCMIIIEPLFHIIWFSWMSRFFFFWESLCCLLLNDGTRNGQSRTPKTFCHLNSWVKCTFETRAIWLNAWNCIWQLYFNNSMRVFRVCFEFRVKGWKGVDLFA